MQHPSPQVRSPLVLCVCSPCSNCLGPRLSPLPLPFLHVSGFCLLAPEDLPPFPHIELTSTSPDPCPSPPHPAPLTHLYSSRPPLYHFLISLPKCLLLCNLYSSPHRAALSPFRDSSSRFLFCPMQSRLQEPQDATARHHPLGGILIIETKAEQVRTKAISVLGNMTRVMAACVRGLKDLWSPWIGIRAPYPCATVAATPFPLPLALCPCSSRALQQHPSSAYCDERQTTGVNGRKKTGGARTHAAPSRKQEEN